MKTTAIYVRVSSKRQDTRSQTADLKRWASQLSEGTPVRWFQDKAPGGTMERPAWERVQAEMDAGRVSKLVVWRLDRLGRTASGLTKLFDQLQKGGVAFESLRDSINLATPSGRLMACVLASVAAYENEVRAERIRAGQAAARAQGKRWGGSEKGRRLSVTDEQVATVRRMAGEGESKAAMVRATGLSRPTVYRLLGDIVTKS